MHCARRFSCRSMTLLAVVREFLNPHVSRSGLDRWPAAAWGRQPAGAESRRSPSPRTAPSRGPTNPATCTSTSSICPRVSDEDRRRYLFVAIDRATRWVFRAHYPAQTPRPNARRFLRDLEARGPLIPKLSDADHPRADRLNGKGFHRPPLRAAQAGGGHRPARVPDMLCAELGIEHRLTPPMRHADERHGRALQRPHRGRPTEPPLPERRGLWSRPSCATSTFTNRQLPQSAPKGRTPINALKDWQRPKADLFQGSASTITRDVTSKQEGRRRWPLALENVCRTANHVGRTKLRIGTTCMNGWVVDAP